MIVFVVTVALLVSASVLYLVVPLLRGGGAASVSRNAVNVAVYRDQLRELENDLQSGSIAAEDYERARQDIEKRLLEDVSAEQSRPLRRSGLAGALAVALAIPVCAVGVYWLVGTPEALNAELASAESGSHQLTPEQIEAMVGGLVARLKQNPDNAEGWATLARTYSTLGKYTEATAAYAESIRRLPKDAQLLADYADALGMAQGRRLQGEPEKLIARALAADPNNVKALALAGTVAFDKKDYATAATHWERILQVAPPDSRIAQQLRASVDEARARAGKPPLEKAAKSEPSAKATGTVSGVAKLSPQLAGKVSPGDTVFIYARAAEGPRLPLAILRKQASDLPVSFVLDDSMAMNRDMKLSSVARVIVSARVSKKSDATARPGDLEGQSAPVPVGAQRVEVLIDSEVR
jgi:cytochrome c-type biogenesis protein CcmH